MKKINIQISKAQIDSYSVELKDNKPEVSATIALIANDNNPITTYSISTDAWNEKNKFKLPTAMISPIVEIMKELEPIIVRHCMGEHLKLNSGG